MIEGPKTERTYTIDEILYEVRHDFIELKIQNNNRFYFIYGKIILPQALNGDWLYFFDRIDGKIGIRKDTIAGVRKADPGRFKLTIDEFDRKLDKILWVKP